MRPGSTGGSCYGRIGNSIITDGSPNCLLFGADGGFPNGIAFLDTTQTGVAGTTPLAFRMNGTEYMRVHTNGSVGIGTTSPVDLLEVKGSITVANVATSQTFISMRQGISSSYNCSIATYDHNGDSNYDGLSLNGWDGVSICTGSNTRNERMRVTQGGSVGIGTSSPTGKLTVAVSGDATDTNIGAWSDKYFCVGQNPTGTSSCVSIGFNNSSNSGWIVSLAPSVAWRTLSYAASGHAFYCQSSTASVTFDSAGKVGIGTTSPVEILDVRGGSISLGTYNSTSSPRYVGYYNGSGGNDCLVGMEIENTTLSGNYSQKLHFRTHWYATNNGRRMTITEAGNVGIGTTSPSYKLHISSGDTSHTYYGPNTTWGYYLACGSGTSQITSTTAQVTVTNGNLHLDSAASGASGRGIYINFYTSGNGQAGGNGSSILSYGPWVHTGSFTVTGGTKSFRIPHPVVPNKDLVHSCVEGPRNDLIYRGTVTLINGTATVNMNKNSTTTPDCAMTDGTFEALCTNPQFFLQNMSGFDRVRGTMSGANLVIISENQTSTDVISWMVVAERHDAAMISTNLTNDAGYLVTEHDSLSPNPYSSPPPS
jgi:hypothetical protein